MAKRQTSDKMSKLAGQVLSGTKKPTAAEARRLAASVLGQDEKKGAPQEAQPFAWGKLGLKPHHDAGSTGWFGENYSI